LRGFPGFPGEGKLHCLDLIYDASFSDQRKIVAECTYSIGVVVCTNTAKRRSANLAMTLVISNVSSPFAKAKIVGIMSC
jgi:hypothetical protein